MPSCKKRRQSGPLAECCITANPHRMLQQSMARGDGLWMFIGDERLLWFHDPTHKEDGAGGILANSIDEGVVEG